MGISNTQRFFKEQLIKSPKFTEYRDILIFLMEDEKKYSIDETEKLIENYLRMEAK